ncbi:hypothetical protein ACFQU7_10640 [Pseudoroseomonas wenyumeiae]
MADAPGRHLTDGQRPGGIGDAVLLGALGAALGILQPGLGQGADAEADTGRDRAIVRDRIRQRGAGDTGKIGGAFPQQ